MEPPECDDNTAHNVMSCFHIVVAADVATELVLLVVNVSLFRRWLKYAVSCSDSVSWCVIIWPSWASVYVRNSWRLHTWCWTACTGQVAVAGHVHKQTEDISVYCTYVEGLSAVEQIVISSIANQQSDVTAMYHIVPTDHTCWRCSSAFCWWCAAVTRLRVVPVNKEYTY